MKRVAAVLVVILIVVMAPSAFADHCQRCRAHPPSGTVGCAPALYFFPGYPICYEVSETQCAFEGEQCIAHGTGLLPLETEFLVVSVERLDEPAAREDAHRVADASTTIR